MPNRPKLARSRRSLALSAALALAGLLMPARSIFGPTITGGAKPSRLVRLIARQPAPQPPTDHDLERLKVAQERRARRAWKKWTNAFRTVRGKYNATMAEHRRVDALFTEAIHAQG